MPLNGCQLFFSLKGVALRILDMNTLKTAELQRTIEPMQLINSFHLFSFGIYMLGLPEKKKLHKESLKDGFQLTL